MRLTKAQIERAMGGDPIYVLQGVGVYAYLTGFASDGLNPGLTIEHMMSRFRTLTNDDFRYFGRVKDGMPTGFLGSLSYNFTDDSVTPPSAHKRPSNGLRGIEDGKEAAGLTSVWQYYRSALTYDQSTGHVSTIRLFNDPAQQKYVNTTIGERVSDFVPPSIMNNLIGFSVSWRIILIDISPEKFNAKFGASIAG